jgi:HK97 family phage major capsid protein
MEIIEEMSGDKQTYSIRRALQSAMRRKGKADGFEGEVSQEIAHRSGKMARGFFVPLNTPAVERRIDNTTAGAGAAATIWPDRMFIDVLRAKLVIEAMGGQITTLTNENGVIQLPVQTAATPVSWVAEGSNYGSFTSLTLSSVTFTPHTCLANTGISYQMSKLDAPGFEEWLFSELAKGLAVAIDAAAIGSGATNSPSGILQNGSIGAYTLAADAGNGGAPAYADLVAMEAQLTNAFGDYPADSRVGWVTSPNGRSKLRRTDSASAGTGQFCWDRVFNTVLGYPAMATTNVPNNATKGTGTALTSLIFGNFQDVIVNLFSGVDILVNPFTLSSTGYIQLSAYQEADVQITRAGGFVVAKAMVTT